MALLAFDLGGTKLSTAVLSTSGEIVSKVQTTLNGRKGNEVGKLITQAIEKHLTEYAIEAVGVSVPGISRHNAGTVWAPNIEGWEDYPLAYEIKKIAGSSVLDIDSDRACSIYGEQWRGNARGCQDAVFLAVGTGIGAGIVAGGNLIRGSQDIAGAIGWWALHKPFDTKYTNCGNFEYYASGAGIPKLANEFLERDSTPSALRDILQRDLTTHRVLEAYDIGDQVALDVMRECITYWGMAAANLVSIFNPEKIIFGGGMFGPAIRFIDDIKTEALKWAQPISIRQVSFEPSALGTDAALFGAGFLALKKLSGNG